MEEFIRENLAYYEETQGMSIKGIDQLGKKYHSQGYLTRDQLYNIAYESSTRSAYHVEKNTEERCEEVTRNVLRVDGDFSKVQLLTGLRGFKAPTASCVLAALNPDKHAVVDTRVWASLERKGYLEGRRESFNADHYIEMIEPIREIAEQTSYNTTEVGFALFAYDDKVRDGTLH